MTLSVVLPIVTCFRHRLPKVVPIRNRQHFAPFLNFEPLLDRSLLEIRQEFDLLPFIK